MASAPSMSVSIECVNLCKLSKGVGSSSDGGGGSSGRYECSVLSCAWKAPRVLTGFLASTTQPQCLSLHDGGPGRRHRLPRAKSYGWRYEDPNAGDWNSPEAVDLAHSGRFTKSSVLHIACKEWKSCCSSSSSESSDAISPETLWEDLKPTIEYLPPEELKLVNNALKLAFEAHDGQKRRSGEPFIIHPVEVARILGELACKRKKHQQQPAAPLLQEPISTLVSSCLLGAIWEAKGWNMQKVT